jgi:hypothetical protein
VLQHAARRARAGWVNRFFILVDVANDAVLVDYEGGAIRETLLLIENSVVL